MKTIERVKKSDVVVIEDNVRYVERYHRVSFNAWELIHDSYAMHVCGACGSRWENNACQTCDELPAIVTDIFVAKRIRFADAANETVYISGK